MSNNNTKTEKNCNCKTCGNTNKSNTPRTIETRIVVEIGNTQLNLSIAEAVQLRDMLGTVTPESTKPETNNADSPENVLDRLIEALRRNENTDKYWPGGPMERPFIPHIMFNPWTGPLNPSICTTSLSNNTSNNMRPIRIYTK